jgi:elongation factor P--(R)-beta-lysine ligase
LNLPNDFLSAAPSGNLKRRAALLRSLRAFFDDRGFTEVQTPVLSRDTIIDRHLDPIEVRMQLPGGKAETWFLQTSPEQSMKRLLCSEIGSIYQIGPVFRSGELGRLHNPEFTLAEWYDVNAGLEEGLVFLSDLISELLSTPIADRIRFEEAFRLATQLDLFECSVKELAEWSVANGLVERTDWSQDWDDWVNLIFSDRVQGKLGADRPVLVTHFPISQAALARVSESDARTAERYEAFYLGVELANGYHELLDADLLEARARKSNEQRQADGNQALPMQNRLLDAMRSGMPSSCGCALGFDRIVMLACQANSLEQVIAFTAQNA